MTQEYYTPPQEEVVKSSMDFYAETATGARRIGMLSSDALTEALHDSRTITAMIDDGREVVVAVPIDYAVDAGYDVERCTEQILPSGHRHETFLYLPNGGLFDHMDSQSYEALVGRFTELRDGYVFASHDERDVVSAQQDLDRLLRDSGKVLADVPLRDSGAKPENELASLSVYAADMPKPEESKDCPLISWDDVYITYMSHVKDGTYPYDTENGTVLMRGSELSDGLADDMWKVYEDRFQELGENHPINMEDAKEGFIHLLRGANTLCSIRFQDGKPLCFADLVNGTEELYWLNQEFLKDPDLIQRAPNQLAVFFPGIVAGKKGTASSVEVISLLTNAALDTGGAIKILFENTNRSEGYIPDIVQAVINHTGRVSIDRPKLIDKTYYTCTQFLQRTYTQERATEEPTPVLTETGMQVVAERPPKRLRIRRLATVLIAALLTS